MRLFLEDSNLADAKSRSNSEGASTPRRQLAPAAATKLLYSRQLWAVSSEAPPDLSTCKFQIYGYLLRMGVISHQRGSTTGEDV